MIEFAWAIVRPDGHVLLNTECPTEDAAWGWAGIVTGRQVESAKAAGYRALRVRIVEAGPA